jgi:23S rRNA (guanosine2251-2'-O)-methyltransferase
VDHPGRVALVLGNEDHGVTRACLALCHAALYVPMYGKGKSLNVHVSLAVVGYHILHRPA